MVDILDRGLSKTMGEKEGADQCSTVQAQLL